MYYKMVVIIHVYICNDRIVCMWVRVVCTCDCRGDRKSLEFKRRSWGWTPLLRKKRHTFTQITPCRVDRPEDWYIRSIISLNKVHIVHQWELLGQFRLKGCTVWCSPLADVFRLYYTRVRAFINQILKLSQ